MCGRPPASRLDGMMTTKIALALTGAMVSTVVALPPAAAMAAPAAVPAFAFDDCPPLPAGADPAKWRCEEMHATGSVSIGAVTLPVTLKTTHAEGRLPGDTQTRFVFGTLRSDPVPVPGGLLGHRRPGRVTATLQYAGHIDFLAGPPMAEILHLKYRVNGPLIAPGCTIGTEDDPLVVVGTIVGDRVPVSDDPPVLAFRVEDHGFAVPRARGCGPLGVLVDRRFGLPGTGTLGLDVYFSVRAYDTVTPRR
jgi:hypothetical protein